MNYLSVCSGIEAATTAWHHMGWKPLGFSEIEKFPSEVLKYHYPTVTNFGDMTKYKEWNVNGTVELLVGGTPCQSFSVAGLRKGLEDPRGNLALTYCGILDHFRPKWFIWENVPGVLSSNRGRDFGSFLGALAELGYGFAYRVLDAQHFGVPQRRRRVFVVGHLGDWRPAAEVLFESSCLSRDTKKSGQKRESSANFTERGVGTNIATFNRQSNSEFGTEPVASTIKNRDYKQFTDLVVYETHPADSRVKEMGETCQTVTSRWGTGGGNVPLVQQMGCDVYNHAITGEVSATFTRNSGNTNTAGPKVLVQAYSIREDAIANNFSATPLEVTPALQALRPSVQSHHAQTFIAHAFKIRGGSPVETGEFGGTPGKAAGKGYLGQDEKAFTLSTTQDQQIFHKSAVRRLTPTECERLQGFPDDFTKIPWRGKAEPPDAPRYKALGNSMAVPCMRWIGERIKEVENELSNVR